MLAVNANAMIMTLNLTWDFGQNIQEGSIVQVVAYRTGSGSAPTGGAANNFEQLGELSGVPYYDSESVVRPNHELIESFSVQENASGYFILEQFEISYYNRVYIRIFSGTNLNSFVESFWGLSGIYSFPQNGKPYTINLIGLNPTNSNYFGSPYFEVIPEPNLNVLLIIGSVFMLLSSKRCKILHGKQ